MKKNLLSRSLATLLLVAVLLIPALCVFPAHAQDVQSTDFSDPYGAPPVEWTPSKLLSLLIPDLSVSSEEAEYLDRHSDIFLLFNNSFSNDVIDINYSEGILNVTAEKYSYTSANGSRVVWTPTRATFKETDIPLTANGEVYVGAANALPEESVYVSVSYTCSLLIPKDTANELINYTYREASKAVALKAEHEAVMGEYLDAYLAYEQYLNDLIKYDKDLLAYENYLVLKSRYDKNLASYNKYLAELADYNARLDAYNEYLEKYNDYLEKKALYEKLYNEHIEALNKQLEYYNTLNKIRASMYAIENIYTVPSAGQNPLFVALQNKEMVAMFEKYKGELTKYYGVSASTIDHLSDVSDDLNDTLKLYGEARKVSEQAAFEFYLENYDDICEKFNYLYDSMVEIMTPTIFNHICTKMEIEYGKGSEMAKYKQWRVTNVLAQIFLTCQCLDDTTSADGSWLFYNYEGKSHRYYFTDLISPNVMISDTDAADPSGLSWPEYVPEVVLPEVPKEPAKVVKPLPPTKVKEPTPPTVCNKPTVPTEVSYPGEAPADISEVLIASDIIDALESGELSERAEFASDVPINFEHTVEKLVSFENKPVMTVYDYDLTTVIDEKIISSPEDIVMPSAQMSRAPSEKYTYSFEGWSTDPSRLITPTLPQSRAVSLPLDEDFCIYAVYSPEERLYRVTWVTANGTEDSYYTYGATPSFEGDVQKPSTNTENYAFDRWYPMPDTVIGDVTYTAKYITSERLYSVVWNTLDGQISESYPFNATPIAPINSLSYLDGCVLVKFTGWDKDITGVTQDKEYTALYSRTTLVTSDSDALTLELVDDDYYLVSTKSDTVAAAELFRLAAAEERRIELDLDGITVSLDVDTVKSLAKAGADEISAKKAGDDKFFISTVNSEGDAVSAKGEIRVYVPTSITSEKNFCVYLMYLGTAKMETPYTLSDGCLIFEANANAEYLFEQLYSVTLSPTDGGGVIFDSYVYSAGDKLSPTFYPASGYELGSITVTRNDTGESFEIDDIKNFEMPESNITLKVTFKKLRFTVSFVVNGEIVSSEKYEIGSTPKIPKITEKYEEDGYNYIFTGWSPNVSIVTGDVTYTAKYSRFLIVEGEDTGDAIDGFLRDTVFPIALVFTAILLFIVLLIILIKNRRIIAKQIRKIKKKSSNKK